MNFPFNNPLGAIQTFIQQTQQNYGNNFDPAGTAKNMLGNQNCQTPQQALEEAYRSGKINKQLYEMGLQMMRSMG